MNKIHSQNESLQAITPSKNQTKFGAMIRNVAAAVVATALMAGSCSKNDKPTPTPPPTPPTPTKPAPTAATLGSPADKNQCVVEEDGEDGSVEFKWTNGANTDNVDLKIWKPGVGDTITRNTTSNSQKVVLPVNNVYAWRVDAKNTAGKTSSSTYTFQLVPNPASNAAPYAATFNQPTNGAVISLNGQSTVNVTLDWTGADPDGTSDIAGYNIYLDGTKVQSNVTASATTIILSKGNHELGVETIDKKGQKTGATIQVTVTD